MPVQLDSPLSDALRGPRLFAGEVLIFRQVPAAQDLVALALRRLRSCFPETEDPATAQRVLAEAEFLKRVVALTAAWRKDPEVTVAFARLLTALGCDPAETYVDDFYLRTQPSQLGRTHRRTKPLHAHRDTWGSNLTAQVNWWLPVTPLTAGRTLALFPRYWAEPIANDSADWDWEELKAARRRARDAGRDPDAAYPTLPQPLEPVAEGEALLVLPEVGDVVAFSAAQLHASVPNHTGVTRFSLETRTVWTADLEANRGAPNLDGRAPRVPREWFRRLADGSSLADT
ncbi:hypothetical protein [Algihabitans albus]|uniref:hypothetical protein n=1 Tax=Algihabitans albus TaxID=2164067 RepID=UPI000E5CF7E8|nr:hypothetical protein [Algihabitans albus]